MASVLVVDDEPAIRQLLCRWLAGGGHVAREADCAEAALDAMATAPAQVVFCDILMPGEDGLWLTARLRERYPMTAVILATGVASVPAEVSMRVGVVAYLMKPLRRPDLEAALDTALNWHETAKAEGGELSGDSGPLKRWLDGGHEDE